MSSVGSDSLGLSSDAPSSTVLSAPDGEWECSEGSVGTSETELEDMERKDEREGLFCTGLFGVCRSRRSSRVRAPLVGVSVVIEDVLIGLCGVWGIFDGRVDDRVSGSMTLDSSSVSNFLFLKFVEGLSNSVTVTDTPSASLFLSTIDFDPPFVLAFEIVVNELNG